MKFFFLDFAMNATNSELSFIQTTSLAELLELHVTNERTEKCIIDNTLTTNWWFDTLTLIEQSKKSPINIIWAGDSEIRRM